MTADPTAGIVQLTLDGRPVVVPSGSTVLDAARTLGIDVPVLCHAPDQAPVGVCRVCMVEVKGARALAAACVRGVEAGMEVQTSTDRVLRARRTVYEMLLADHPSPCLRQRTTQDCELETLATRAGVVTPRFAPPLLPRPVDDSSPIIRVELDACILCDRCIRGCSDTRNNFVIGRIGKGETTRIAFDDDAPMGRSTCVGCGECMVSCPTGALTNKRAVEAGRSADGHLQRGRVRLHRLLHPERRSRGLHRRAARSRAEPERPGAHGRAPVPSEADVLDPEREHDRGT